MITMIDKHKIITLHNKGMSQRKIADDLGISRNTVASYIKNTTRLALFFSHLRICLKNSYMV